jgi:hypothetical protein
VIFALGDNSDKKPIKARIRDLTCNDEHLDKLYMCTICNMDFLFRLDVEEHHITTGHNCRENVICLWLDDVTNRLEDYF